MRKERRSIKSVIVNKKVPLLAEKIPHLFLSIYRRRIPADKTLALTIQTLDADILFIMRYWYRRHIYLFRSGIFFGSAPALGRCNSFPLLHAVTVTFDGYEAAVMHKTVQNGSCQNRTKQDASPLIKLLVLRDYGGGRFIPSGNHFIQVVYICLPQLL